MKINILLFFLLLFSTNLLAKDIDCSKINKLSKEYAKCIAELAKEKGTKVKDRVTSDESKNKISNIKSKLSKKLRKFKNSKTGEEFLQKN